MFQKEKYGEIFMWVLNIVGLLIGVAESKANKENSNSIEGPKTC